MESKELEEKFKNFKDDILKEIKKEVFEEIKKSNDAVINKTDSLRKYLRGDKSWYSKIISWMNAHWIILLLIFMVAIAIRVTISPSVIENDTLVITFVGILATFVVVGNYMQVKEIKDEFNSKAEGLKSSFEEKYKNEISSISKKVDEMKVNIHNIDIHLVGVDELKKEIEVLHLKSFLHYYTLESLICYESHRYPASLQCAMTSLDYLNRLNKISYYSFGDAPNNIKRLSSGEISPAIHIYQYEKDTYLKTLSNYNGADKLDFIEFIERLKVIQYGNDSE